jgi:hypothetical protein
MQRNVVGSPIKHHPAYPLPASPFLHFEGLAVAMHTLKTGGVVQGFTCRHTRSIQLAIRPQRPAQLVHRPSRLVTRAQPDGKEPEQQQPEQKQEQPVKGAGTLSNRYEKMVEELQKAGLTPAKAKVCDTACVSLVTSPPPPPS